MATLTAVTTEDVSKTMAELMDEIRVATQKQCSSSRVDEIRVMRTMLNDESFHVSIYDRNKGYIGQRCPREEAVKFIGNVSAAVTGLETKAAMDLADNYEFTKRDAVFLIENARDFTRTYLATGRKLPIVQAENAEASLLYKSVSSKEKVVPTADGGKHTTIFPAHNKVVCRSKSPKYCTIKKVEH